MILSKIIIGYSVSHYFETGLVNLAKFSSKGSDMVILLGQQEPQGLKSIIKKLHLLQKLGPWGPTHYIFGD